MFSPHTLHNLTRLALIDEIHAEEMQYQAPKHKVRKRPVAVVSHQPKKSFLSLPPPFPRTNHQKEREGESERERVCVCTCVFMDLENSPLMTQAPKLRLILRIRLDPQTGRQDELSHRGAEAGEERIERLYSPSHIFPR